MSQVISLPFLMNLLLSSCSSTSCSNTNHSSRGSPAAFCNPWGCRQPILLQGMGSALSWQLNTLKKSRTSVKTHLSDLLKTIKNSKDQFLGFWLSHLSLCSFLATVSLKVLYKILLTPRVSFTTSASAICHVSECLLVLLRDVIQKNIISEVQFLCPWLQNTLFLEVSSYSPHHLYVNLLM